MTASLQWSEIKNNIYQRKEELQIVEPLLLQTLGYNYHVNMEVETKDVGSFRRPQMFHLWLLFYKM